MEARPMRDARVAPGTCTRGSETRHSNALNPRETCRSLKCNVQQNKLATKYSVSASGGAAPQQASTSMLMAEETLIAEELHQDVPLCV